ncbi:hypothetical protein N7493_011458 [Penicillium malachiteum]|uniref:Uncharacterized protein n=1 Tax=Penicillium malachiteum TaxID=1324776 RepID=A0AAD6HAQ3_9EURO|nr:hypothetical protein N7493_011458 [Penicillium malachiteum]
MSLYGSTLTKEEDENEDAGLSTPHALNDPDVVNNLDAVNGPDIVTVSNVVNGTYIATGLNLLNSPFRPAPTPDEHDSDSVAITSDDMSFTHENLLSSRERRETQAISIPQAAALIQPSYTEELDSQAVISDDVSISSDTPLALSRRARRQNRPIPLDQIAACLLPSRAEELEDSVAVTSSSPSVEDMSVYQNPYPLTARLPRPSTIHPIAPAAHLLPSRARGRRRGPGRSGSHLLPVTPHGSHQAPHDSNQAGPSTLTPSISVPAEYGYGYGFSGYDRARFFLSADYTNPRPVSDPTGQAPSSRNPYSNPYALSAWELQIYENRSAVLARQMESLDLFPGVELSSSEEEPSVSGMESSGIDEGDEHGNEDEPAFTNHVNEAPLTNHVNEP